MFSNEDTQSEAIKNEWENISIELYKIVTDNMTERTTFFKNPLVKCSYIKKDLICLHIKYLVLYFLFLKKSVLW